MYSWLRVEERTVLGTSVPHQQQQRIDKCPNAQSSKREQLEETVADIAQVESIGTESTEKHTVQHGTDPLVPGGEIAYLGLDERPTAQT